MDGGDSNSGGLKIHHDNSQPTSTSPTGSGFESLETNTSTTSSGSPVAPVNSPTPTPAPTPVEATSPDTTETTAEVPIATPVSMPSDATAGPAPGTPLDTPISSSATSSAPTPSTPTPGTGFTTPGSFATPSRFPTPQNRVVPPQQPAFPPAVSPAMGAGIMSSRFDTGESYASEPKSTGRGKKLAIVLVLLLLIVAIGVGIWWVLNKGSTAEVTNESLNKYFNYLLFETDSSQPISNDTVWSEDKILENLPSSGNGNADYFNKLSSLYDVYYSEFNESEDSSKDPNIFSSLQAAVDNNKFAIETLLSFSAKSNFSSINITKMYFADGKDNTLAYVTNYYQNFIDSDNSLLNNYGETAIKLAGSIILQIEEYSEINCVQNNAILESCASSPDLPEEIKAINEEISLYMLDLNTSESGIISNVIDNSREIYLEYAKEDQNE